jgi:ABC-type Na+ efflux pump permease subunit
MRFWKSWIVTQKDLSIIRKNKYVFYSLIALPLLFGIILPLLNIFTLNDEITALPRAQFMVVANQTVNELIALPVLIAVVLPSIIASYSFVGEKIEKSLEPLLATPTTDSELLLGKSLASFLPCIGATYLAGGIFAAVLDGWSYIKLGVVFIPNPYWALYMFVIAPLAGLLGVEANIIVSSKVNDVRSAQQLGALVCLPIIILVTLPSAQYSNLIAILLSTALAAADIALFYLSKKTFGREEILTNWK